VRRVLLALLVVACLAAVGVAVWRSGSTDACDVIELTVWDWWSPTSSDDYERYFGEIKEIFEREHPGIRIRYQFVPFATYMQKLTTGYCGPNPPDVYQCSIAWAQTLWERGVLMELTDLVARTPELRMEQFLEAAVRHNQLDGHIYGVPIILDAECLVYNLDMFEKAGLPTDPYAIGTWADLRRFARALTRETEDGDRVAGFGFAGFGSGLTLFGPMLFVNGGQFWTDPPYRAAFNSEAGLEVIDFLRQLYYEDGVCPSFSPQLSVEAEFYAGRVAMFVGGTWSGKYIDRDTGSYLGHGHEGGLRYRMTNFPPGPSSATGRRSTMTWGNMMVISRGCEHPEAAWEYIKLVAGLEGCLLRLKHINQNAPRKDFYTLRREDMPQAWHERGYPTWAEIVSIKPYLAMVPEICNSGAKAMHIERQAVDRAFRNAYETVMLADEIPKERIRQVFDETAAKVNRIYDRLRPR